MFNDYQSMIRFESQTTYLMALISDDHEHEFNWQVIKQIVSVQEDNFSGD